MFNGIKKYYEGDVSMGVNKEKLISLVKDELQHFIGNLSESNLSETVVGVRSQLDILEAVDRALFLELHTNDSRTENDTTHQENEIVNEFEESVSEDGLCVRGYYTQFIRGGCILPKDDPNSVFVPEKVIRDLELKTGDFLQAAADIEKGAHISNPRRVKYQFEKLKETDEDIEDVRFVESLSVIQKRSDLPGLYVSITQNDNDLPFEAKIMDVDITKYRLQEGDIIDYAYSPENFNYGKVIWKYEMDNFVEKIAVEPKKKEIKRKKNMEMDDVSTSELDSLRIVTVGGDNLKLHKTAKNEIEKRGGILEYFSGNEPKETIISRLKIADLVAIYTESISHSAMNLVKENCKKYDIKYLCTKNIGGSILVKKIEEMRV